MTLDELLNEVYALTVRPDLVADTKVCIRAATLKMHSVDFFYKDMQTALVTLPQSSFQFTIDTSQLAQYRAMSFIRKYYPDVVDPLTQTAGFAGEFLVRKDITDLMDSYRRAISNVWWAAGTNVNVRSAEALDSYMLGYYARPNITDAGFSSWVAVEQPYAIVISAAAMLFKTIGYDEQSQKYGTMETEQIALLKMSNIVPEGF